LTLGSERLSGPLPDDAAFPLRDAGKHVGDQFALRCREINAEIDRNDVEAMLPRLFQQTAEIDYGARESVELGDHDTRDPSRPARFERAAQARTIPHRPSALDVLFNPDELPTASRYLHLDRVALSL
jgi:hypothetical protein